MFVAMGLVIALSCVVPIAMIVMGALFRNDCPAEPHIPVFLIIAGDTPFKLIRISKLGSLMNLT